MERILTVKQMRDADEFTINKLGVSNEVLLDRAGHAVAEEILKRFKGGRVLICIGKGNNGKDGVVVYNILSNIHGFNVTLFDVFNDSFDAFNNNYDIIIDCIFGTGLNKTVVGKIFNIIEKINSLKCYVISCDIPSGLNGDNGLPMGIAVKANLTVAIQDFKPGHFLNNGKDLCGEVVVKDIGISVWEDEVINKFTKNELSKFFPQRKNNVHKGMFGKACVFGGSKNFPGSAIISANGLVALKMGVGYSNLAIPNCVFNAISLLNPELTITVFPDDGNNIVFSKEKLDKILGYDTIAFGMGVGVTKDVYESLRYILNNFKGRLIIDADGLNVLSTYGVEILNEKTCEVCLTPHIGEFCRLTSITKDEILKNGIFLAKEFAKKYKVVLALKSSSTIITDGDTTFINSTGCSGMAKGGSGDLLSGIIAGLSTRKIEYVNCVSASCFLFGLAGEKAKKSLNDYCMTVSDIIKEIPSVLNEIM